MTVPWTQIYRLVPRGGAGLACDQDGIALGAANLVRTRLGERGRRHCEVQPPQAIRRVLTAAYGPQPDEVVQRLHRGLRRAAARLEAGDLAHAGIETVMLGLPEPAAMAKLAGIADLEKGERGDYPSEPRLRHSPPGRSQKGWIMVRNFEPYIPTGMGALMDFVGTMMSGAPVFKDTTGDLPNKNIETKFYQLYEGLKLARPELGEELYAQLRTMGEQVYAHFLADQGGETEETTKGCKIIHQMDDLLIAHARRGR